MTKKPLHPIIVVLLVLGAIWLGMSLLNALGTH